MAIEDGHVADHRIPHRLEQLGRAVQCRVRLLSIRDVANEPEHGRAATVRESGRPQVDPEAIDPAAAQQLQFVASEGLRAAADALLEPLGPQRKELGRDDGREWQADELAKVVAEHPRQRRVGQHEAVVLGHEHAVDHRCEQRAIGRLAFAQRLFGVLALGDVAGNAKHANDIAGFVVQRPLGGQVDDLPVDRREVFLVGTVDVLRHDLRVIRHQRQRLVRREDGTVVAPEDFLGGALAHLPRGLAVAQQVAALAILGEDRIAGAFGDGLHQCQATQLVVLRCPLDA